MSRDDEVRPPRGKLLEPLGVPDPPEEPKVDPWRQWVVTSAPGVRSVGGWNVDTLNRALLAHVQGQFNGSGVLSDDLVSNPIISHALQVRQEAFTTLPRHVTPARLRDATARKCADFVRECLDDILPDQTLRDMHRHRLLVGQSVVGVDWEVRKDGRDSWWLPRLKPWHPSLTYYVYRHDPKSADGGRFWATTLSHGTVQVEPGLGRWLLLAQSDLAPWMLGLVRALGEVYLGDTYNFRDNLAAQERFAQGIFLFRHPVDWNDQQIGRSVASIQKTGSMGVVPLPFKENYKTDLELLKTELTGAAQSFDSTEKRTIRRILIALLGQDMTTVGQTGGFAQAAIHNEVLWHKRESDAAAFGDARLSVEDDPETGARNKVWVPVTNCLRRQLLSWIAYFNFGSFDIAPYVWWDATPPEDIEAREERRAKDGQMRAQTLQTLANAIPLLQQVVPDMDVEFVLKQCGVPLKRPPSGSSGRGATRGHQHRAHLPAEERQPLDAPLWRAEPGCYDVGRPGLGVGVGGAATLLPDATQHEQATAREAADLRVISGGAT